MLTVAFPATVERMNPILHRIVRVTVVLSVCACASAPAAPPQSPPSAPPAAPIAKSPTNVTPESSAVPVSDSKAVEAAAEEPAQTTERDPRADGDRKASRPPIELITNGSVLFVFSFGESVVGQTAKEQCNAASGGDRAELADCLQKARSKVPVESVRFLKKDSGEYWWVTFNNYKGNLLKWHIIQFQVGEQSSHDEYSAQARDRDRAIKRLQHRSERRRVW